MDSIIQTFGLALGTLILCLLAVGAVLWLVLPLYVYQIRNRLDQQIKETQEVRYAIKYLANQLEKQQNAKN